MNTSETTENVSMLDLHRLMKGFSKDELILDVREPSEYSEGHIAGSLNIPVGEVASKAEELRKYKKVYVHCRSGIRSQKATAILKAQGLNNLICISDGGMMDWEEAGLPVSS